MAYVAGHGFPVPAVQSVDIEMELLDGSTLLDALVADILDTRSAAKMLADLHNTLHALPTRTSRNHSDRLIHLDLHPENVMVTSRGPVVIDWAALFGGESRSTRTRCIEALQPTRSQSRGLPVDRPPPQ